MFLHHFKKKETEDKKIAELVYQKIIDNVNLMDEAFICSSVVGVLPCFWDGWKSDFKLTKRLQFLLEESLEK